MSGAKKWLGIGVPAVLLVGVLGCHEGPAEQAGEKIDKGVDKAGDSLERAGDRVQDRVDR